ANGRHARRSHGNSLGRRSDEAVALVEAARTGKARASGCDRFASEAIWDGHTANDRRANRTAGDGAGRSRCANAKEAEITLEAGARLPILELRPTRPPLQQFELALRELEAFAR